MRPNSPNNSPQKVRKPAREPGLLGLPKPRKDRSPKRRPDSPQQSGQRPASSELRTPVTRQSAPLMATAGALAPKPRFRGGGSTRDALTLAGMENPRSSAGREPAYTDIIDNLPELLTTLCKNPQNNILLMTDGYKFSHHKQYPVSWMPEHARPEPEDKAPYTPPIFYGPRNGRPGTKLLKLLPVPCFSEDLSRQLKVTL